MTLIDLSGNWWITDAVNDFVTEVVDG